VLPLSACAAPGGGHTLCSHDLGMILALHNDGVCDGAHWLIVMKNSGDAPAVNLYNVYTFVYHQRKESKPL
jgi:hypothetical protein